MIIFLDIETVDQSIKDLPLSDKQIKANIERYWEKINFMPEFTEILTICVGRVEIAWDWIVIKNLEWSEKEQIVEFFKIVWSNRICWFNIKGFDIPFIIKRALKHKISIPSALKVAGKKPWEITNIIDLQEMYRLWVFGAPGNLDTVCRHLWITSPKNGWIDGSKVQSYHEAGKDDEIIEYCKRDVEAVIDLYKYFKEYNLI